MIKKSITINNKYGLHTRAATKLLDTARQFQSKIELVQAEHASDCKSIMSLITLGAKKGAIFDLVISGDDEIEAHEAVTKLIHGRFGEEE